MVVFRVHAVSGLRGYFGHIRLCMLPHSLARLPCLIPETQPFCLKRGGGCSRCPSFSEKGGVNANIHSGDRLAAFLMAVTACRWTDGDFLRNIGRDRSKLPRTAGNIIEFIVGDSTIGAVFWCIFITAVGLTCIFTIVGLVKNMVANNRNVSTIVGKFFLALLGTMAMLAVVILGILIANSLLQLLARIFQVNNTTKLSTAIFNACVGEWLNGYSASNIDVTSLSVGQILGGYNAALFGI